jgi:hypothetical protein
MIILEIEEAEPVRDGTSRAGLYLAYVGDDFICASRWPFLDGARQLLAWGYDPDTPLNMRHKGSNTLSFVTTTIGLAAAWSVEESRMRFRKFTVPKPRTIDANGCDRTTERLGEIDTHIEPPDSRTPLYGLYAPPTMRTDKASKRTLFRPILDHIRQLEAEAKTKSQPGRIRPNKSRPVKYGEREQSSSPRR